MGVARASDSVEIDAPAELAFAALTDYETFPDWQSAVRSVEVLERDEEGRGKRVAFEIDVKVKRLRYVNAYAYDPPGLIDCRLVEGDIKFNETLYRFEDIGGGRSRLTADFAVDPGVFVPGPIKKMITGQMLRGNLQDLKARAESLASRAG